MQAASGAPWWVSLLAALIGGAVTGAFAIGGIIYAQRQQAKRDQAQRDRERERDHYADSRTLRDGKRERLRAIYAVLVASAWAMNDFPVETQVGPAEETKEEKQARLKRWVERANHGADEALVQLALERDADNFKSVYTDVQVAFTQYRQAYGRNDWCKAPAAQGKLHNAVHRLDSLARGQLAELDQPTPPLAPIVIEPTAPVVEEAPIRLWHLRRRWQNWRRVKATGDVTKAGQK